MIDLMVYYVDGTLENVAVQTLGVSFSGGCAASVDRLDLSEVEERGIVLTRTKVPTFEKDETDTFLPEVVVVPPERMRDAVMVKNGLETIMFRDRDGVMIRPELSLVFGGIEAMEHVANAVADRLGLAALPDSVLEKLRREDSEEDAGEAFDDVFS